jgi:NADH:ubiquinone oxidoreductase subunit F (NADH-binding)/NADH:ubiquinone oxidoreductase subunit E
MAVTEQVEEHQIFTVEQRKKLEAWKTYYPYPIMGLIPAMRDVQQWQRHISLAAEAVLAEMYNVPLHWVHEVATFYPHFTTAPTGKYRIGVCRNLSCALAGSKDIVRHLRRTLGIDDDEVTADGLFSIEEQECLGACDHAPAVSVNDELVGAASEEAMVNILAHCRSDKPLADLAVRPGTMVCGPDPKQANTVLLTENFSDTALHGLDAYKRHGGYKAWARAKAMEPAAIIEEVKRSNLRGLGGAGFPSGMKWGTVPLKKDRRAPHYLVANADESEPGCYKDRVLMERNPHALIEGMLIAGRAIDADAYILFMRGEYAQATRILERAIAEAKQAELLDKDMLIMKGAGAYISGCDTALLETLEGKKAWPRQPPPFPTVAGLMNNPTVVNNVETLMMVTAVMNRGGDAFAKIGVAKSGGTAVYSLSGHVEHPGIYEFPMGTPLKNILAAAGGVRGGKKLKAVIPGGTSTPILSAEEAMKVSMDFDGLRTVGSFLGAGGIVVLDESTDIVETLHVIERFLAHESCGQCTPCREGSGWSTRILERILDGGGVPEDLDNLLRMGENISGKVICALGDTVGMIIRPMIAKFRPDFEKHIASKANG